METERERLTNRVENNKSRWDDDTPHSVICLTAHQVAAAAAAAAGLNQIYNDNNKNQT